MHNLSSGTFNPGVSHRFWLFRGKSSRQLQRVTAACPPQLHIIHNNLYVNFPNFCIMQILHVKLERSRRSGWHSSSVARRGEFSRFVGFLAQKGGQIFEDGDLWELFKKGGILKNFTKIGKFSYFSTKC